MCKKLLHFNFFLLFLVISEVYTGENDENCPSGMFKTILTTQNLKPKGLASGMTLIKNIGTGALWLTRKINVKPRFEVNIRTQSKDPLKGWASYDRSFTVIIAGSTYDWIGGWAAMGGLKNGVAFQIVFEEAQYSYKHLETRYFDNAGTMTYTGAVVTWNIDFNLTQNYRIYWSMDHSRASNKRGYYSILDSYGHKYTYRDKFDASEKWDIAYFGFVSKNGKRNIEIGLAGTFICEDYGYLNNVMNTFSIPSTSYTEESIEFTYSAINYYNQSTIFFSGIQTIKAVSNDPTGCTFSSQDTTSLVSRKVRFTCTTAGTKKIGLYSSIGGTAYKTITFYSKYPTKIVEYGHDGKQFNSNEKINLGNNKYDMKYSGNPFIYVNGLTANFEITAYDGKNNVFLGSGLNLNEFISKLQITISSTCSISSITTISNSRIRINLLFSKPGECNLNFGNLNINTFIFKILPAIPNPSKSTCELLNYKTDTKLKQLTDIQFRCTLKDQYSNSVSPINSTSIYKITYSYKITKSLPNNKDGGVIFKSVDMSNSQYITYTFQTKYMGKYKVDVYINNVAITSTSNTFFVDAKVTGFTNALFYTIQDPNWKDRTDLTYKADDEGKLLIMDLTDTDNTTLISTYEYPSDFQLSYFKTNFTYPHCQGCVPKSPAAEFTKIAGKTYIAIKYSSNTDNYIKRDSYSIGLNIYAGTNIKTITIKYQLNISPYVTCYCGIGIKYTLFTFITNSPFEAGNQYNYFKITLRKWSNLHNYQEKIEFKNKTTQGNNILTLIPDKKIDGIYSVEISTKTVGTFTFQVYVKDVYVRDITYTVIPSYANSIEVIDKSPYKKIDTYTYERDAVTTDDIIYTEYNIFDYLGNIYNIAMDADVEIQMLVNKKIVGNTHKIDKSDFKNGHYIYEDKTYEVGEYEINIKILSNGNIYTFKYTKIEGKIPRESLRVVYEENVLYPPKSIHSFSIYYYNQAQENLVIDETKRSNLIKNTKITVTYSNGTSAPFNYNNTEITSDYGIKYYTTSITVQSIYKVNIKYSNNDIKTFTYEIGYYKINPKNSIFYYLSTHDKFLLSQSAITISKKYASYPKFRYYFYNENNEPIYTYTSNPNIIATLQGNGKSEVLTPTFNINNGYVDYYLKNGIFNYSGLYYITLKIDNVIDSNSNYSMYIVNEYEAIDSTSNYEVKYTYFPFKELKTIAGKKESFIIELKTDTLKRYDKEINTSIINITDTNKLIDQNKAIVEVQTTPIKGQLLISITQKVVASNSYIFSFKNPTNTNQWIESWFKPIIKTTNAEFNKLEISKDIIKSETQLKDGTAGEIYSLILTPKDIYGNIYNDFFDETKIHKDFRNSLITFNHSNNGIINIDSSYDTESSLFFIYIKTNIKGIITISSKYMDNKYTLQINEDIIDYEHSIIEINSKYDITPDTNIEIKILPKDKYDNIIENGINKELFKLNEIYSDNTITITNSNYNKPYIIFNIKLDTPGEVYIEPIYNENIIQCSNCKFNVKNGNIDYNNINIIINDMQLETKNPITLDTSLYPIIKLELYDEYKTIINDLKDITVSGSLSNENINFDFISYKENGFILLIFNLSDKNIRDKWLKIENGEYKLAFKINNKDISYTITIMNKRNTEDESTETLNNTLTTFTPDIVNIKAGEKILIEMKQYGKDGKRYNKWYDNPNTSIKLGLSNNKCSNNLYYGSNPGIYLIELQCTQTYKLDNMKIIVENTQLTKIIPVTIIPSNIKSIKLSNNKSTISSNTDYIFTITPYDEFNNIANVDTKDILYTIKSPNDYINSNIVKIREKNTFNIQFSPSISGTYTIESSLLSSSFKFTSTITNYSATYSKVVVDNTDITAGNELYIYIIPYDDQNNYKEADSNNCPFTLTYKIMDGNEIEIKNPFVREYKYKNISYKVYAYARVLTIKGNTYFTGKLNNKNIYCELCNTIVSPKEIDLSTSLYERYVSEYNKYEELYNNIAEDNYNSLSKYRLYPKDMYGNTISNINNINDLKLKLSNRDKLSINCDYKIVSQNEIYSYIDFIPTNDNTYKELPNGLYELTFTNGDKTNTISIYLKGNNTDYEKGSEEEDLRKATISDTHLTFEANKNGYFYLHINTINAYRKNTCSGYQIKVTPTINNPSFNYSYTASSTICVFLVTVYSKTVTTNNQLKIELYSPISKSYQEISSLKPKMTVTPGIIKTIKIDSNNIKSNTELKDGNIDDNTYEYTVIGYDEYDNKVQCDQNTIKLNLNPNIDNNTYTIKSNIDGSLTYIYEFSVAGKYKLLSEYYDFTNKIKYLNGDYTININKGAVKLENSLIEKIEDEIEAGKLAHLKITLRDKKNNIITPTNILTVRLFTNTQSILSSTYKIINDYLYYTVYTNITGISYWGIKTNNIEELLITPIQLNVNPSDVDILSTVYRTDKTNLLDSNTYYIISNNDESLGLVAEKYDIYGNILSYKNKMNINYAVLTGNYMEDITLINNEQDTEFEINMPLKNVNKTAVYTLNHLVKGDKYKIKIDLNKNKNRLSTTTTTVKNENEFINGITKGGLITISQSITITKIITISKNVEINLNGYTLTVSKGIINEVNLIIRNGSLTYGDTNSSIIKLSNTAKYYGYNIKYINAKSVISLNEYGYAEIVDSSMTGIKYLIENNGYTTNKVLLYGNIDASTITSPITGNVCNLIILGGKYGFNTKTYLKSNIIELPVLITSNKDDNGYGNGPLDATKTVLSQEKFIIPAGESDVLKITFKNKQGLLFNDDVTIISNDEINVTKFNQIVITPKHNSLQTTYQTISSSQSTILITSTLLYNNSFTLKITDKNKGSKTFTIYCNIRHGYYPDPNRTIITYPPESIIYPPNNYISFTFKLYDKYGNIFEDSCDEMQEKVISLTIDGVSEPKKSIDGCEYSGSFTINRYIIPYPPFNHNINIIYYYNDIGTTLMTKDISILVSTTVDYSKSEIQCAKCESVKVGEKYTLIVSLFDVNGECFDGNYTTNIPLGVKISSFDTSIPPTYYSFKLISDEKDECKNQYEWIYDTPITKSGLYKLEIFGKIGNENITFREYNQQIEEETVDINYIYVERISQNTKIKVDEYYEYSVYGKDKYENIIPNAFDTYFKTELRDEQNNIYPEDNIISNENTFENKKYTYKFKVKKLNPIRLYFLFNTNGTFQKMTQIYIDNKLISMNNGVYDNITLTYGDCSEDNPFVNSTEAESQKQINKPTYLTIQCYDKYGNKVEQGGAKFTVEVKGQKLESEITQTIIVGNNGISTEDFDVKSTITDNLDGTYKIMFIPEIEAQYSVDIRINDNIFYYQNIFTIKKEELCPPVNEPEKKYKCPNKDECVEEDNIINCLDDDEICKNNKTHPFNCKKRDNLEKDNCVTSFTECNCPKGYEKCDWYQNQCYNLDRDYECPFILTSNCKNKGEYRTLCDDGVCRLRADLKPNKYVCPYPYIQCSDLSCRLSFDDCPIYKDCGDDEIKCDDQSCKPYSDKCPSRITCINPNDVVCPDGTCVANELLCKAIECYDPTPYLCPSGVCAKDISLCPSNIVCGHTYSLCEDNVCRHDCRQTIA